MSAGLPVPVPRGGRVAFLIDADNLSADVIEQAIEWLLQTFGAIHFRRAYASPQKAVEHVELFRRHSIRPMVNVPTGKNSTDIALAVDAIDLAITERPDVVVIGSSDSDYAPLALRLREKGCRVLGIGQAGKTGGDSPLAYDEFIDLAHRRPMGRTARSAVARASPPTSATTPPPPAQVMRQAPESPSPAPPPRRRAASGRTRAAGVVPPPAALAWPAEVEAILQAVPGLRQGGALALGEVGEALRRHALLKGKSASPSRLLKRHGGHFELAPVDRPRTVRFLGAA